LPIVLYLKDANGNQITGDSKVPGYEGYIDVLEFSWGMSTVRGTPMNLRDITIKKSVDAASVLLMAKASQGEVIQAGNLIVVDTSSPGVYFLQFEMSSVTVEDISIAGTDHPTPEAVILRYDAVGVTVPGILAYLQQPTS
jgi:type VI protein secretion system component Hcp